MECHHVFALNVAFLICFQKLKKKVAVDSCVATISDGFYIS